MTTRHDHWIDGRPEPPAGGTRPATLDPATRLPGDEIAAGGAADIGRAVAAAERARQREPGPTTEGMTDVRRSSAAGRAGGAP
ncbi:hypothetical protein [Streptomyces sp. NPDC047061]|uniref:hypothetical protein n=1 Tax=Streptomyces sp. NPDC047061 TaxID=3154605 RepID=UPI0033C43CD3